MTNDPAAISRLIDEIDPYLADLEGPGVDEVRQCILRFGQSSRRDVTLSGAGCRMLGC